MAIKLSRGGREPIVGLRTSLLRVVTVGAGLEKRLAAHRQANVHVLVREFEDPYPSDAPRPDLVTTPTGCFALRFVRPNP
jgi:hypothetical protein